MLNIPEITNIEGNEGVLDLLVQQICGDGITPVVGSGFSLGAGFPSWHRFTTGLAPNAEIKQKIQEAFAAGDFGGTVQLLLNTLGHLQFYDALRETYGARQIVSKTLSGAVTLLPRLVENVVFTNSIDTTIEEVFVRADAPFERVYRGAETTDSDTTNFEPLRRNLIKLLGDADHSRSLLLINSPNVMADLNRPAMRLFLQAAQQKPVFFLAYSQFEPSVVAALQNIASRDPFAAHYALLESPPTEEERQERVRFLYRCNVRQIWYPTGRYDLIEPILTYLIEQKQSVTPKLPAPEPPQELIEACAMEECVLYVGSGLSAPTGLPTWQPLVAGLTEWAGECKFLPPDYLPSLREALDMGQTDTVADSVVSYLPDRSQQLSEYLRAVFVRPNVKLPATYDVLREIPFSAILTTNFDDLLEQTYTDRSARLYTPHDAEELLEAHAQRQFFLLKLYGTVERPETLLVAPKQYEEVVSNNLRFGNLIDALFVSHTLLFLGASLEGIEAYLSGIRFKSNPVRKHFALINVENEAWRVKGDLLERRYGIKVIPYRATEGFPEVLAFLKKLATQVRARRDAHRACAESNVDSGTSVAPARLKSVTLENIGPFDRLELEINSNWQVLLGDNGVGKSSILKAIGVAVCGEEARFYAGRIIKHKTTSATITLGTDRGTKYVVQLLSKDGGADVIARPGRLLETENWLVLAFPALRGITWNRPRGEPERRERPTTEDIIPLLSSKLDTRLDSIKQWLLTLDHQIQTDQASGNSTSPYLRLREQFFEIIRDLTPGIDFRYIGVEPKTRQVTIQINNAEVPIEVISQGTASLIGWVGVLLQRLYDVTNDQSDPLQRYALVLIDEIDAHMHPFWQQFIVPAIQKRFPNVQFIATTHSPLLVGDLKASQVLVLDRDQETGSVAARPMPQEHADADFAHLRTDQILTSALFGLLSTRGKRYIENVLDYSRLLSAQAIKQAQPSESPASAETELASLETKLDALRPEILKAQPESASQAELTGSQWSSVSPDGEFASSTPNVTLLSAEERIAQLRAFEAELAGEDMP